MGSRLTRWIACLTSRADWLGWPGCPATCWSCYAWRVRGTSGHGLRWRCTCHRVKSYIGAYAAVLGGLGVLAFTDEIGVRALQVRERACADMAWFGVKLDVDANHAAPRDRISDVSTPGSAVRILIVPADEEWIVANEGLALLNWP